MPVLQLSNTHTDGTGASLLFNKNGASVANGDVIGNIIFSSEDSGDAVTHYAEIVGKIAEKAAGNEGGQIDFHIATHNGSMNQAMKLVDGSAAGEVDVTIANGADSVTTIAGNLVVTGDLTPSADDTHDLGTTTNAWQDLHLEGDVLLTDVGKIETAAGDLTVSSVAAQVVIDAETDIELNANGGDFFFKDATVPVLNVVGSGGATGVSNFTTLYQPVDNLNLAFAQFDGVTTAMSMDWAGQGAFGAKKGIASHASALDLSSVATAMGYLGATITVNNGSAFAITLPTATSDAEALQVQGWHIRVLVIDPQGSLNAAVTVVRGDTSADMIFGNVYAAAEDAASDKVTIGSSVVTFTAGSATGDYVDITCVSSVGSGGSASTVFHATGFAST